MKYLYILEFQLRDFSVLTQTYDDRDKALKVYKAFQHNNQTKFRYRYIKLYYCPKVILSREDWRY